MASEGMAIAVAPASLTRHNRLKRGSPVSARISPRLEILIGGAAVLISLASLGLTISANRTQERLLAASTWPYLVYGTGNRMEDGTSAISMTLHNGGVGPARLAWLQVSYEGQPRFDAASLLLACCNPGKLAVSTVTSAGSGVIGADSKATFLVLPEADNDPAVWSAFNRRRFDVQVRTCFCSVLKECWMLDSQEREPEPVAACPQMDETQLWHG